MAGRGGGWQCDGWWDGFGARASAEVEEVGPPGRFEAAGAKVCHMGMMFTRVLIVDKICLGIMSDQVKILVIHQILAYLLNKALKIIHVLLVRLFANLFKSLH